MSAIWSSVGGQWRHAFVRAAIFNDFADEVAIHVRGRECGADEVGATAPVSVRAMAESAGLRELFLSSLGCFSGSLLASGCLGKALEPSRLATDRARVAAAASLALSNESGRLWRGRHDYPP